MALKPDVAEFHYRLGLALLESERYEDALVSLHTAVQQAPQQRGWLLPLAKAGTVVPVAVSAARRSPLAPEVPTMMESGLPRFSYGSWYGVWAPKGLPTERVQALNLAIQAAVAELDRSGAFVKLGIESVRETPEQTRQFIAAQVVEGAELLKAANFNPE